MTTNVARRFCIQLLAYAIVPLLLMFAVPIRTEASLLRGRLLRLLPNGQVVAVSGVSVTVFRADIGRSVPSVTDANGMYYLNVPAGDYVLEIWVTNPPKAYQIRIVEPNTDIVPIYI